MPTFVLKIKCELENIAQITPQIGNLWKFDISDGTGGETREGITISDADELELEGSRGTANFIIKFDKKGSQCYMKIVPVKKADGIYRADQSGTWVTMLGLECRGMEPSAWIPGVDFNVESTGGGKFEGIDLSDKDWADYDEDNDLSVSITGLEFKIERV